MSKKIVIKDNQEYFSPTEVARITGYSYPIVLRALHDGSLRGILGINKRWKVVKSDIAAWMKSGKNET